MLKQPSFEIIRITDVDRLRILFSQEVNIVHTLILLIQIQNVRGVRLACIKHAASVHPEPGSNSQLKLQKLLRILGKFHPLSHWLAKGTG